MKQCILCIQIAEVQFQLLHLSTSLLLLTASSQRPPGEEIEDERGGGGGDDGGGYGTEMAAVVRMAEDDSLPR